MLVLDDRVYLDTWTWTWGSLKLLTFPTLRLFPCFSGMGWRTLPEVSVWGQQCPPRPGAGEHSSPATAAAYLLSSPPAGQWWRWQPTEAAYQTHPPGRGKKKFTWCMKLCLPFRTSVLTVTALMCLKSFVIKLLLELGWWSVAALSWLSEGFRTGVSNSFHLISHQKKSDQ